MGLLNRLLGSGHESGDRLAMAVVRDEKVRDKADAELKRHRDLVTAFAEVDLALARKKKRGVVR